MMAPRAGSQRSLRDRNKQVVLDALTTSGPQTQAALARMTGLSTGTISNVVADLKGEGRVKTRPVVVSGRRSLEVSVLSDSRVVVGIDIGRSHLRLLASDAAQHTFGDLEVPLEQGHRPHETFALARRHIDALLERHELSRGEVAQAVVTLPASLSGNTGRIVEESALPHWARIDLRAVAHDTLDLPVMVEHDAPLGALAHTSYGRNPGVGTLVYVKIASGIGMGIVIDGRPYSTSSGVSGEIGHFPVEGGTEVCYCGKRGCLETVSSARRVIADFERIRPGRKGTVSSVIDAVNNGDAAITQVLAEAGIALGRQLGLVATLLSPDVIVLGGPLMTVGRPYLEAARLAAQQVALPSSIRETKFELSDLDGADEVYGACALGVRSLAAL